MTDITPARANIQVEESRFRYAVAESFAQKVGGSINFINDYQHSEKQWFVNGKYWKITTPFSGIDGMTFFQFNAAIIDAWMFVQLQTGATSGNTQLDIKRATTPGGSFTSIFSTVPQINYNAGDNVWIHLGSAVANTTAPVLSGGAPYNVNAGDALRCDLLSVPSGSPSTGAGCGILVHYRPR